MSYARPNDKPDAATLIAMHRQMLLIRRCEERLERDVKAGNTPGQVHLSTGQEAVPVGLSAHLDDGDKITSTHRGHGHFLAKGGDPQAMFAEIYGMAEGVCGGMGGSMHVADVSKGILGANGIVGAGLAIATGGRLRDQARRQLPSGCVLFRRWGCQSGCADGVPEHRVALVPAAAFCV